MPSYQILALSSGNGGHCYWIYAVCDVAMWRHIHVCKPTFWRSLLTQPAIQGRRSSGRAGAAVKQLTAIETYKNRKIVTKYVCFYSSTMLTSKITTKFVENHSEFSGCPNSCNKFVSSQSSYAMNWPIMLLWKAAVLEVGVRAPPQKFDLLKIWAQSLKIRV